MATSFSRSSRSQNSLLVRPLIWIEGKTECAPRLKAGQAHLVQRLDDVATAAVVLVAHHLDLVVALAQRRDGCVLARGRRGHDAELMDFADRLEEATIRTIEEGKMTKDLALITTMENPTVLNSEGFIKAIAVNL